MSLPGSTVLWKMWKGEREEEGEMEGRKEGRKKEKEGRRRKTTKLMRGQLNAGPQIGNCYN